MNQEININEEIQKIHDRNARVAADKAWEMSFFRRGSIAVITYVTVVIVLTISGAQHPFVGAIVPPIGYLLSTLSLPFVKTYWLKVFYRK